MKLMNVMPVPGKDIITEEDMRYITRHLHKDTIVDSCSITGGAASIECEYDEALNSPKAVELCIQAEKDGYQGCFINCFGDPGVRAARECVDIPVFGGFEPAIHIALGLGDRIGIITVLKNLLPFQRNSAARAHLDKRVISVRSIDIPVLDLADHNKLCDAVVKEALLAIEQDGVEVIVMGCTGIFGITEVVQRKLLEVGYDLPIIEAGQSAMMMLELYARMGLKQSRITYMKPPKGL